MAKYKGNETTLGEALSGLMKKMNLQDNVQEHQVSQTYEAMVGPAIASRTSKILFRKGVLFLWITSSPLKHELFMARERLKGRLNEELKSDVIRQIIFK